jgi:hypothetical protein
MATFLKYVTVLQLRIQDLAVVEMVIQLLATAFLTTASFPAIKSFAMVMVLVLLIVYLRIIMVMVLLFLLVMVQLGLNVAFLKTIPI